ncbi:MAG: LysM peptidoglycan-binding domain-containing protein [Chloroflexi bacterium]|nr:LysM peptidoglycan-binding domain-containing protein [Chloroflexota bacterium]
MSRARVVSIIVVLVLANYLVFSNLAVLLFQAGGEAATRLENARQPRITLTPTPTTAGAQPSGTPAPPDTPTPQPTMTATPTRVVSPTPAVTATPAPSPTVNKAAIPIYTPGTPLKYPFRYTVKQGDTLSGLAARFSVPAAKILAANGIANADLIRIGQELIIPDPAN